MSELAVNKPKSLLPTLEFDGTATPAKTVLFLFLCGCWLIPGLIGHDPWKPEEAHTFGVVYEILRSGNYVMPTLAGETYLDKPPLYYWSAAWFARAFSGWLPLHDGARLATGFYMALTLTLVALSGINLFGPRYGRLTALILLGSLGLLFNAHAMVADVVLLTGVAMAVYGLSLARFRPVIGGALLGIGVGVGFLGKGVVAPLMLAISAVLLPALFPVWRTRVYWFALALALAFALPWLIAWPYALYARSPQHFQEWLWLNEFGTIFQGTPNTWLSNFGYYVSLLPWYAWPALLIAIGGHWYARHTLLREPAGQLLIVVFGIQLLTLAFLGEKREVQAMPMLVPLSLLAASGIDSLKRGAASALDWFGMMTFGLFAILLWLGWLSMLTGTPQFVAQLLGNFMPGFELRFHGGAFVFALVLTVIWLIAITRSRQSNRRAVVNWAAGISMFWMLAMTLWLPYIDEAKTYRKMVASLQQALPRSFDCLASRGLGEPQRAMLDYFLGLRTERLERGATNNCSVLLIQGKPAEEPHMDAPWRRIWEGTRPGDITERFWLYRR